VAKRIIKRAVNIVMLNGDATGVLEVAIPGSQSMAYKIPREQLANCKTLGVNDFNSVYFLFGGVGKGKPVVYIGQAGIRNGGGAILTRLAEHDKKKDFWTEAFVFTNTNDMFGPTELNFLENTFCNMALDAGRFEVKNGNNPNQGNIKKREAELEPYIYDAETLLSILGYKVFEPVEEEIVIDDDTTNNSRSSKCIIPELPDSDLLVGEFIHQAMRNLSDAEYVFSEMQLNELLSKESSKKLFNVNYPFMCVFDRNAENPHHINGVGRYYSPYKRGGKKIIDESNIFVFDGVEYLVTKETFAKDRNKEKFIDWYETLRATH